PPPRRPRPPCRRAPRSSRPARALPPAAPRRRRIPRPRDRRSIVARRRASAAGPRTRRAASSTTAQECEEPRRFELPERLVLPGAAPCPPERARRAGAGVRRGLVTGRGELHRLRGKVDLERRGIAALVDHQHAQALAPGGRRRRQSEDRQGAPETGRAPG